MKAIEILEYVVMFIICAVIVVYAFIGAVLQESYKLTPLTEREMIQEVYHE